MILLSRDPSLYTMAGWLYLSFSEVQLQRKDCWLRCTIHDHSFVYPIETFNSFASIGGCGGGGWTAALGDGPR